MSKTKCTIKQPHEINWKEVEFTPLEENERIPSQLLGYVRDKDGNQIYIQLDNFKLDNYGIPDGEGPFYQTVKQQAHCKLPMEINENVEGEDDNSKKKRASNSKAAKDCFEGLDRLMESPEMKEQLFKEKAKKYKLTTIVRKPVVQDDDSDDSDDDDDKKEKIERPSFMKCKIPLTYPDEEVNVEVYRKNKTDTPEFEADGKYTKLDIKTLADLKSHIVYMRDHKFVLHLSKVWASKQPLAGQTLRNYGVTFKLVRVQVENKPPRKVEENNDKNPFIDSDDESDEEEEEKETKEKHFEENDNKESDGDDSDSSESEKKVEKKPVKKRSLKKNA
jgi:hypothetical protein